MPLSVIEAARAGDAEAVERVLRYYSGYMNKLCTRTLYDENGYPHVCLDEAMKRRLEKQPSPAAPMKQITQKVFVVKHGTSDINVTKKTNPNRFDA